MIKVKIGQNPYDIIGQYIIDHITIIENTIAKIEIDGKITNELFLVDDGKFNWENDWYEGEKNIELIDFYPVSVAIRGK